MGELSSDSIWGGRYFTRKSSVPYIVSRKARCICACVHLSRSLGRIGSLSPVCCARPLRRAVISACLPPCLTAAAAASQSMNT